MEQSLDAVVVGAGPAGSSAAVTLARRGFHVALVEAKRMPRDTLCGEFLSPECGALLSALGLYKRVSGLNPVPVHTVEITARDGASWQARLPGAGWGLSRCAFDAACAEGAALAGAHVYDATRVTQIEGDLSHGFRVQTSRGTLQARTVICAHGKRAALDRALSRDFIHQQHPFVALKAHFHGPPLGGKVELHTFPGGYAGLAEIEGNRVNVCLLVRERVFKAVMGMQGERVEGFIGWMQMQNPRLHAWLAQSERVDPQWLSIAQVPFVNKRVVENGILMVGDAAGLIVPVAGDGIAMALKGGIIAGEQCARQLLGQETADQTCSAYCGRWEREFSGRVRLARLLQRVLLRPSLASPGLRALARLPTLGNYLVHQTRGSSK